jgi:ribosomal protein S27E
MARIKNGIPTVKEVKEGESIYRYIQGVGLVLYVRYNNQLHSTKMQPLSTPAIADKKLNQLIKDEISTSIPTDDFIKSDGSVTYRGSQSFGGNNITGVNDLTVGDDVSIGDDLDVDGHTTLDQVTVNTTDGAFAVSGANPITLTTTGSNDIDIVSNQKLDVDITSDYELNVGGDCNWGITGNTDYRSTGTWTLTSVDNLTIETNGASTAKTILLFNDNDHASSFRGIHLKTDSGGTASVENSIFIECDGRAAKGGGDGVDIRSEDGILIRAENPNSGLANNIQIRATEHIDLAGNSSSITPTGDTIKRTKIHGISEFEAINTNHLVRAQTYKASFSNIGVGSSETIVSASNDDNGLGTVWLVTIVWHHGAANDCMQSYICFGVSSTALTTQLVTEELATSAGGSLAWTSGAGIVFTNNHSGGASNLITTLKASALRLQSKDDF